MARKTPKLTIVPVADLDMTTLTDMTVDTAAMLDALAPIYDTPVLVVSAEIADAFGMADMVGAGIARIAPPMPIVPSLAQLRAESVELPQDVLASDADTYTLVITGAHESLMAAGMFAGQYAKLIGAQVCVVDASGTPVRCYDPPVRGKRGERGTGGTGVAGPRGADWSSKSGQAIKLMMRADGATMDEMKEITGWTFGKKYVEQLMRSFGVAITTHEATARTKRTWHAAPVTTTAHLDDAADDEAEPVMLAAE